MAQNDHPPTVGCFENPKHGHRVVPICWGGYFFCSEINHMILYNIEILSPKLLPMTFHKEFSAVISIS